ncbi:hypothetical protein PV336_37635 [Streptomyces sp. MI02-2A]|uniref:hypothetical protein n=1 Tax=unclassified Streptomyces TaxID=2593676 RepID=UPI000E376817|nr:MULTISPECIES: hypothetical protein [unclassified Streptomyces]MDX3264851.1 hypothetical protein [Streptomyces sp. MI02-2A]REE59018.1 hypothetical protein BX257_1511 [Streptomyces sp. 3212.3]
MLSKDHALVRREHGVVGAGEGRIPGKGYIDPDSYEGELRYRLDRWARQSLENRTASKRYKLQKQRALEMYIFPTFGNCDIRSAEHFSKATIGAWVNKMLRTKVKRGARINDMSLETLRGRKRTVVFGSLGGRYRRAAASGPKSLRSDPTPDERRLGPFRHRAGSML